MKRCEFHTKRLITKKQEQAYRLCHQDFEGLTVEEAAERLGIHPRKVYERLARMEKIAPQLFPILLKENLEVWKMWHIDGLRCWQIAEELGITESAVIQRLNRIRENMGYHTGYGTGGSPHPDQAISLDAMDIDTVIVKKL